jgi:sec-independent protein translocase protein TatA
VTVDENWGCCGTAAQVAGEVSARIRAIAAPRGLKEQAMGVFAIFGPIGLPEMLIILVIIMLIFGASRLPEIGKGIGQGIKNFKSSIKDPADSQKNS